jgi:hypothetical protein
MSYPQHILRAELRAGSVVPIAAIAAIATNYNRGLRGHGE